MQSERLLLVDLIGRHDCIYVYLLVSAAVSFLFFFDMVFRHTGHLLNLVYYVQHSYFAINRFMSQKVDSNE